MNNNSSQPDLVILAGPNGAGKSTVADFLLENKSITCFVNADTIAKGLGTSASKLSDIEAGRILLNQVTELINNKQSIAFESTMAGRNWTRLIKEARSKGFEITICYVAVNHENTAIERVKSRVKVGGHSIPEFTIRRRYKRSLNLFFEHYNKLVDHWYFFDNSQKLANLVAYKENSSTHILDPIIFEFYLNLYDSTTKK